MSGPVFEHVTPGRRPVTLFALAFTVLLLVVAWRYDAPWYVWGVWAAVMLAVSYLAIVNPKSGIRLDYDRLTHWTGNKSRTHAVTDIERVEFYEGSDTVSAKICLHSGEEVPLFSDCFPLISHTIAELEQRGVKCVRR